MKERIEQKTKFEELDLQGKVEFIFKDRMPSPEQVIYEPTVEFLDPENELIREEKGRVIAMGDRTAIAYKILTEKVLAERNKEKTSEFYLQYALAARDSKEIAHTSILEQVNAGSEERGGDPPIIFEGVSVLAALRDICSLRHFAFEAFSSRGGIFPENYWRIPQELKDAGIGEKLEEKIRYIYEVYIHLTKKGMEHYLEVLKQNEGEKDWQFRWRVLSHALDDSRQVTNGVFLNHFAMHPNSALSVREALVELSSSELPETVELAGKLRELATRDLPTLMRYTEASPYTSELPRKRRKIAERLNLVLAATGTGKVDRSRLLNSVWVTPDAERKFLAAFLTKEGDVGLKTAYERLQKLQDKEVETLIDEVFSGIGLHDKPPKELEMVQIEANFLLSVGAIYEAVRHRLATHIVGRFTPYYGYTIPEAYQKFGLEDIYKTAIDQNERAYRLIKDLGSPYEEVFGPYFVSRAHLVPVTIRISGLDVFHFLKIRAHRAAHPDIRHPASELEKALMTTKAPIFRHLIRKPV